MIVDRINLLSSAVPVLDPTPYSAAIGSFDGVHRGHQYLLGLMRNPSPTPGDVHEILVVTFDPLPFEVLHPSAPPSRLTDVDERLRLLDDLDVARVAVVEFNPEVAVMSAGAFLSALSARYTIRDLWCGADFAFGHNREGDIDFLRAHAAGFGFAVHVTARTDLNGTRLGSRDIRGMIAEGSVESASDLLGHLPSVSGPVVHGAQRGRLLGFPTANLEVPPYKLIPKTGIYAGHARLGAERHQAAISVGHSPTFGAHPLTVEAYLLDFDRDIYGHRLEIEFAHRLRDDRKFETVEALVAQMASDVARTSALLTSVAS